MRAGFALCMLAAVNAQVGPCPDGSDDCGDVKNGAWGTSKEVIELIDGVILGIFETEKVTGLDTCAADFNPLVLDMVKAVNDFEEGGYRNITDGVYMLGQFISEVGIIMGDCSSLSADDLATLSDMGQAFMKPLQLIIDMENHAIVNGIEIFKDVKAGIKDMNEAKYVQAGKEFGSVGAMVLWGARQYSYSESFLQ